LPQEEQKRELKKLEFCEMQDDGVLVLKNSIKKPETVPSSTPAEKVTDSMDV
jgi:hypothetical protein